MKEIFDLYEFTAGSIDGAKTVVENALDIEFKRQLGRSSTPTCFLSVRYY